MFKLISFLLSHSLLLSFGESDSSKSIHFFLFNQVLMFLERALSSSSSLVSLLRLAFQISAHFLDQLRFTHSLSFVGIVLSSFLVSLCIFVECNCSDLRCSVHCVIFTNAAWLRTSLTEGFLIVHIGFTFLFVVEVIFILRSTGHSFEVRFITECILLPAWQCSGSVSFLKHLLDLVG